MTDSSQHRGPSGIGSSPEWGSTGFSSGDHVGLVGRHTIGLVDGGDPTTRARLWPMVSTDRPLDDILEELSSTGIRALPDFALAQVEGNAVRVVVRGGVAVSTESSDGSNRSIDASDVKTWVEDVIADVASVTMSMPGSDGASTEFAVLAGSVPAGALVRRFDAPDDLAADADADGWSGAIAVTPSVEAQRATSDAADASTETPTVTPTDAPTGQPTDAPTDIHSGAPAAVADLAASGATGSAAGGAAGLAAGAAAAGVASDRDGDVAETMDDPAPVDDVEDEVSGVDDVVAEMQSSTGDPSDGSTDDPSAGSTDDPSDADVDAAWGAGSATAGPASDGPASDGPASNGSVSDGPAIAETPTSAAATGASAPGEATSDDAFDRVFDRTFGAAAATGAATPQPPPPVAPPAPAVQISTMPDVDSSGLMSRSAAQESETRLGGAAPFDAEADLASSLADEDDDSSSDSGPTARPVAVLAFSNGERIEVDRTVLVGRNPKFDSSSADEIPYLMKYEGPGQGLSRSHAEFRVQDGQLMIEDLRSTNGTDVQPPGEGRRRLEGGVAVPIVPGTLVDFGDELRCMVETPR